MVKKWDPAQTTLISLGTGREPHHIKKWDATTYWPWQWIEPILGNFLESSDDQQVRPVRTFFEKLAFYGDELAKMITKDQIDREVFKKALALPHAMKWK